MEQKRSKLVTWIQESITAKMFTVGMLILILLIPLAFVQDLIKERKHRQEEVVSEINNKWGNEIIISGPILKVPYKEIKEVKSLNSETNLYDIKKEEYDKLLSLMPKDINWSMLSEYEKTDMTSGSQELACSSSVCEVVDLVSSIPQTVSDVTEIGL